MRPSFQASRRFSFGADGGGLTDMFANDPTKFSYNLGF